MLDGWIDLQARKFGDAIPSLKKAKALESPAFVTAWLAYAYGASGDRPRAMGEIEDLKKRSTGGQVLPFNLAIVHLGLGDLKLAIDYLERAYAADSQWMGWLKKDRMFDPLRSDPRFVALLKKLGLSPCRIPRDWRDDLALSSALRNRRTAAWASSTRPKTCGSDDSLRSSSCRRSFP